MAASTFLKASSRIIAAEILQHLNLCEDARAVRELSGEADFLCDLDRESMFVRLSGVSLDLDNVTMTSTGHDSISDILLSVFSSGSGWPRQTVGATSQGIFLCRTCHYKGRSKFACSHFKLAARWAS